MAETQNATTSRDFRGLTIFELLIIGAVVLGSVFWALSARTNMQNKTYDEQRKGKVSTLKEALRSFFMENQTFPSSEQFDNEEFRKEAFSLLLADQGQDFLHDPQHKDTLIEYISDPEGCKGNTASPCTKVALTFKLSGGEEYTKFVLEPGKEFESVNEAVQDGDVDSQDLVKQLDAQN